MNFLDKVLEAEGLKYEDLNPAEKEFYNSQNFNIQNITVPDLRDYLLDLIFNIANKLAETPSLDTHNDAVLKARLKNYIVLHSFLTTPEKAEKALKRALQNKND